MSLELEKIYTVKEVAEYGRCTPQYIYKLIKRRKIKAIIFGGYKIKESEVKRIFGWYQFFLEE